MFETIIGHTITIAVTVFDANLFQMASANRSTASIDVNGAKWDRCLTDAVVKTGLLILRFALIVDQHTRVISASGAALGLVFSALLFKRNSLSLFDLAHVLRLLKQVALGRCC